MGLQCCLHSGGHRARAETGDRVWIMSPESLPHLKRSVDAWRPDFLIVDECHTVLEWGNGFRPLLAQIPQLLKTTKSLSKSLWLTATLSQRDHLELLKRLPPETQTLGRFELPPRLRLRARHSIWPERDADLKRVISICEGPGLIFAPTRRRVLQLVQLLREESGLLTGGVIGYHAGLSKEERLGLETQILRDPTLTVVATSAFGMGMDFAQFRWTVLTQTPWSRLALAQAIGRVGRNEKPAMAWILWDEEDFQLLRRWKGAPCAEFELELRELEVLLGQSTDLGASLVANLNQIEPGALN